jgi:S-DNA-T family DNA segregation ATPase FtsK/SpoIIIE
MQEKGFVGPFEGSKPRKVLISLSQWLEYKAKEGI